MKVSNFATRFSVMCLPQAPRLFMMNMQVFAVRPDRAAQREPSSEPQAIVWCAVYQRPAMTKR